MKRITLSIALLCLIGMAFQACQNSNANNEGKSQITKAPDRTPIKVANAQDKEDRLGIGDMMPMADVKMQDISGEMVSLKDAMGENGLIVNFSCNTCPFVIYWEDRYPMIEKWAAENKMGVALINSNEAKRQSNDMEDSFVAMQNHAKEMNYDSYYLVDTNHKLADAMSAFTTPHIFLFNGEGKLVYKGAIDDNYKIADVEKNYLQDAIKAVVNGGTPDPAETKGNGCSIKRLKS